MSGYVTLPVPERIQRLKEELYSARTAFCFERARIVSRSYRETEGQHTALRRAKALYAVFAEMPIFIRPGELLVGQRASTLAGRAVYQVAHPALQALPHHLADRQFGPSPHLQLLRLLPQAGRRHAAQGADALSVAAAARH